MQADGKGPQQRDPGGCLVIHLYLYICCNNIKADVDEMLDQFNKLDGDNVGVESKTAGNLPANRKWNRLFS